MACPWQSGRIKRVAKSPQAAETLAMVDTAETCVYYRNFLMDLLGIKDHNCLPICCRIDNVALHDLVHSSTQILDKQLQIETAIPQEMLENGWHHLYRVGPQCTSMCWFTYKDWWPTYKNLESRERATGIWLSYLKSKIYFFFVTIFTFYKKKRKKKRWGWGENIKTYSMDNIYYTSHLSKK